MYSYNDRVRAVELYIKLDKRVRATIRKGTANTRSAPLAPVMQRRYATVP